MPNHIANVVTIIAGPDEERARFSALIGETFDFEKLIPIPASLVPLEHVPGEPCGGPSCDHVSFAVAASKVMAPGRYAGGDSGHTNFPNQRERMLVWKDRDWQQFSKCLRAIMETGHAYWHDWQVANWGTKWNAYDQTREGGGWRFQTAWNTPMPIWEKLATEFPRLTIQVEYADEDIGHNCGTLILVAGTVTEAAPESPQEFAMRLRQWSVEDIAEYYAER